MALNLTDQQQEALYDDIVAIRASMQKHRPFMLGQRHPSGDTYAAMGSWINTLANSFEPVLDTDPETIPSPPLP